MKSTRHQAILALMVQQGQLSVDLLSDRFGVSKETIRRDLNTLQEQGWLIRQHGWAKSIDCNSPDNGVSFSARIKSHYNRKEDIADQALALVESGMVIALDASSTCWYLARKLPNTPLTVFTNSVRVCFELAKKSQITLISSGGVLERKYACYVNTGLISLVRHLDIDVFLFSCAGIDKDGMMWDSNVFHAEYKALLMKRSVQSVLLMDQSKLRRKSTIKIGPVSEVDRVITDTGSHH